MIYIETGSTDVTYNFALEYYFTKVAPKLEPVFLFWRTSPTCMVGKYQNTYEELNLDYIDSKGIAVVRRLSGGGTIYTDMGAWQYTFIQKDQGNTIDFTSFIAPVINALASLGVQADFSGRNDLHIGQRKISGTAQYKLNGYTVHHGSLLYDTDIEEMVAATKVDPLKISSKSIQSVRERVTNIKDHLSDPPSPEAFKELMVSHILGPGRRMEVSRAEKVKIEAIAKDIFASWAHNFGTNPKFTMEKTGRLKGGRLTFRLTVKKGIIQEAHLQGDFFATEAAQGITEALIGSRLEKGDLLQRLDQPQWREAIHGVTPQEMVDLLVT